MKQTPTALLVETKLGQPLAHFVRRHRYDERSWSYIARKLREATGVDFTDESLRLWFSDEPDLAGRAA